MSAERYIEQLVLAGHNIDRGPGRDRSSGSRTLRGTTRDAGSAPVPAGAPSATLPADLKAAVDVGSLLSFVDGIDAQQKDDVLLSVQRFSSAMTR